MASNETSERGGQGGDVRVFNVGDDVAWDGALAFHPDTEFHQGTVTSIKSGGWYRVEEHFSHDEASIHGSDLTLLERAPAPEPEAGSVVAADIDARTAGFEHWNPCAHKRPTVVCLCGSTRFSEAFREANLRETLEGRIVLSIGCDMRSDAEIFGGMPQRAGSEASRDD